MRRGDIWWAELPPPWRPRPVVLVSRGPAYGVLTWVVAAPLTTRVREMPSAVLVTPEADGVAQRCIVNVDNLSTVRVDWLRQFVTHLSAERMAEVDRAIHFALGLKD